MRLKMCLGVKHFHEWGRIQEMEPLWELHSCGSYECLKPWLERPESTKLGLEDTIRKVLKCRCLKFLHIVHLNLIYMSYD
jgi:hypothetical protein